MKWFTRLCYGLAVLCILLVAYYRVWFLRRPDRKIPHNENQFVSPANGTIVSIKPWHSQNVIETKKDNGAIDIWTRDVDTAGYIISIQMDVTNVHYQRAPLTATIIGEHYEKGDFNNAVRMSNEYGIRFENEHNELLFQTPEGKKFKLVQIAGFVARRIEDYVDVNQTLQQGDVWGLIKLGSQVTVILPHDAIIKATVGETVVDGESVIAEWPYLTMN